MFTNPVVTMSTSKVLFLGGETVQRYWECRKFTVEGKEGCDQTQHIYLNSAMALWCRTSRVIFKHMVIITAIILQIFKEKKKIQEAELDLCLSLVFIAVKRHHDQGNSYKGKHLTEASLQRFSPLSSWWETWQSAGRHSAGERAQSSTS